MPAPGASALALRARSDAPGDNLQYQIRRPRDSPAIQELLRIFKPRRRLVSVLDNRSQLDKKTVQTVLAHLENTMVSAIHKKGAGEFTFPGLFKVSAIQVPATKKRFGKNPFTGVDQWFAAKPASVKVKVRAMKKLKDAAL
ncbi:HU family DNA-binding protein [Cupriavidus sp. IK-TO18]|uniref:HU family DNA-binding protein n=1 Tax=Cupriavidus sp. IK-TO18 TaxID=2782182 RepID=UPI0018993748|nr:HU family DNA-binding protein [Cupriavidus sp. IK-TO18]MBF6989317.1 HU family DNA-binding protein [Cupriavidus sp. IK-TO18]